MKFKYSSYTWSGVTFVRNFELKENIKLLRPKGAFSTVILKNHH
jgi:hypothetical protein